MPRKKRAIGFAVIDAVFLLSHRSFAIDYPVILSEGGDLQYILRLTGNNFVTIVLEYPKLWHAPGFEMQNLNRETVRD